MSRQIPIEADPPRVGPYLIDRRLGAGGMGTVYLARHEQTGQQAAIKVLAPSLAREEGLVARFMREIDALQKLKNPHVVELFDHGVDGDMHYYAMEYVDGETLTARLRREKRLPWREVVELSIQICIALKAAHDAGIIHRDLKPSNLILAPDGQIKLTDFGVAQVFAGSKLTVTGGIIGTAEYMSPEQGQGRRITKRSDLYSLGAVMYVMLTGRPPFSGKTTLDVIHKHTYSQFDRPRLRVPDIPHWLDDIVCQLMEKDPEKRFADAYVVNRKLHELLRKVELSTNDLTLDNASTGADASTIDVAAGARSAAARRQSVGPGSGTLMRDLFRAEIEAQNAPSRLRSLLENTWILVGALVIVIAGVIFWTKSKVMTPELRFDKGVALLDENEDANWRTVRDEYFAPLTALKSPEWDE
ncbi:MAG TPA: serine/threonine-protein kinase, partial [Planctomycetaceae bacterium]|nr:serine/threonine-protein kinase [Planctomycetaceae bacterium]